MVIEQIVVKNETPPKIKGVSWTVLRGHSIGFSDGSLFKREINDELLKNKVPFYWRLIGHDHGGGMSRSGFACIITDVSGKIPKNFRIMKKRPNGISAEFWGNTLVEVKVFRDSPFYVEIVKREIDMLGVVKSETLLNMKNCDENVSKWLPDEFKRFSEAIIAAIKTCKCYHCTHNHRPFTRTLTST